jgi:CBS domain-containing protein
MENPFLQIAVEEVPVRIANYLTVGSLRGDRDAGGDHLGSADASTAAVSALVVSADGRRPASFRPGHHCRLRARAAGASTGLADIMVKGCFVGPDDEVESLMAVMTTHRIRHLPVVHEGELVGIVSIGDVVKHRVDSLEDDNRALVDYIHAR